MKKYMHAGAMAILMLIFAAMYVACDSKDEPEAEVNANLVSFSWRGHTYESEDRPDPDKKFLIAVYSKETRQLSVTLEDLSIYPRSGYKGLIISKGKNIEIGFSIPVWDIPVESPAHRDLIWDIEVSKSASGPCSVGIYYLGKNSTDSPESLFQNGYLLTTLELDLDSDFIRMFEVNLPGLVFK